METKIYKVIADGNHKLFNDYVLGNVHGAMKCICFENMMNDRGHAIEVITDEQDQVVSKIFRVETDPRAIALFQSVIDTWYPGLITIEEMA